jgi:sulfate permease, SulP family
VGGLLERLTTIGKANIRMIVCDLSASPYIDLAGSRMLRQLHTELAASGIARRIIGGHGRVRVLLRAEGLGDIVADRLTKLETVVGSST